MKAELIPGWNFFKQIFDYHWDKFKQFNSLYNKAYYDGLVKKMLVCGNPEQIGYVDYQCLDCGQGKHLVAMSCKSISVMCNQRSELMVGSRKAQAMKAA